MNSVEISNNLILETSSILRKFGRQGYEGLALWLGVISGTAAIVKEVLEPPQTPIRGEEGVGFLVSGDTLFALNRYLHGSGLRLIAQVHSHPSNAYHSEADDCLAVATKDGSFSIVVPDFAAGPAELSRWAIYQLSAGCWLEVLPSEKARIFKVT